MSVARAWCFLVHRWWVRTVWDLDPAGRYIYKCVRCEETWNRP